MINNGVMNKGLILIIIMFLTVCNISAESQPLIKMEIRRTGELPVPAVQVSKPNQLPGSRISKGRSTVWLADSTERYRHGILGDRLEASSLEVETEEGLKFKFTLPDNRVFEDLQPRLFDLDGDGDDEIIVVESDTRLGASLSVFGVGRGGLVRIAATDFLGRPNRWLNPVGFGDFNGDGKTEIALVATPHIGGILRLYKFNGSDLSLFSEYSGVSTHRIGSTEMGLGSTVSMPHKDLLLLPDQGHTSLLLLEWTDRGIIEVARSALPGRLESSLIQTGERSWKFRIVGGESYEIRLILH